MDQQDLQNLPLEQLLNQIVALIFELCRRFCVRVEAPLPFTADDLESPFVCGFHCRKVHSQISWTWPQLL